MWRIFLPFASRIILYYVIGTSFIVQADGIYDYTITLKSASIHGETVISEFSVDNRSEEALHIGQFNVEAFDSEGNTLTWQTCGTTLEGWVPANSKVDGNVCWTGVSKEATRVYVKYHHSAFWTNSGTWYVNK